MRGLLSNTDALCNKRRHVDAETHGEHHRKAKDETGPNRTPMLACNHPEANRKAGVRFPLLAFGRNKSCHQNADLGFSGLRILRQLIPLLSVAHSVQPRYKKPNKRKHSP